ncbi:hypothetical protein ACIRF8_15660 [Streptomyces sp. NPDC102406]|uniref:hypothetical protein n=1 Tax=Streptomyces sp. NPDC102406 TaxID=3366171 RepID=UPI003824A041
MRRTVWRLAQLWGDMMRVRATAATAALLLAALTACGGDKAESKPSAAKESTKVDCTDENLSQAEWMENCSDEGGGASAGPEEGAGTGGDGKTSGLKFGESFTWPDGVKVAVVEARVFKDWDAEALESPDPKATEFRLKLRVTNGSAASLKLDDFSTIVEGAVNGGEASSSIFTRESEPLEGRLGSKVTATKTDDNTLEKKYGRKIVVTVQRSNDAGDTFDYPEFEGEIVG